MCLLANDLDRGKASAYAANWEADRLIVGDVAKLTTAVGDERSWDIGVGVYGEDEHTLPRLRYVSTKPMHEFTERPERARARGIEPGTIAGE
jgi:hypothetical protein